jgi:hypothetical protein
VHDHVLPNRNAISFDALSMHHMCPNANASHNPCPGKCKPISTYHCRGVSGPRCEDSTEEHRGAGFHLHPNPNHRGRGASPPYFSSVFFELQLTILTLSACTVWLPLSNLKVTLRIRKVQTSSQKRYVSREPCVRAPD